MRGEPTKVQSASSSTSQAGGRAPSEGPLPCDASVTYKPSPLLFKRFGMGNRPTRGRPSVGELFVANTPRAVAMRANCVWRTQLRTQIDNADASCSAGRPHTCVVVGTLPITTSPGRSVAGQYRSDAPLDRTVIECGARVADVGTPASATDASRADFTRSALELCDEAELRVPRSVRTACRHEAGRSPGRAGRPLRSIGFGWSPADPAISIAACSSGTY